MMKAKLYALAASALFFASACIPSSSKKASAEMETVESDHFSLEIPVGLRENDRLNEDAVLCYASLLKGIYIMVLEDTKEEFEAALINEELTDYYTNDLDGYDQLITDAFGIDSDVETGQRTTEKKTVNGLPCIANSFSLEANGTPFAYDLVCVEGRDHYYQLIFFTQEKDSEKYAAIRAKVLASFREKE